LLRRAAAIGSDFFSGEAAIKISAAASNPAVHSSNLDFIAKDLTTENTELHRGSHRFNILCVDLGGTLCPLWLIVFCRKLGDLRNSRLFRRAPIRSRSHDSLPFLNRDRLACIYVAQFFGLSAGPLNFD